MEFEFGKVTSKLLWVILIWPAKRGIEIKKNIVVENLEFIIFFC